MSKEERLQILREAKPNSWLVFSADDERLVGRGETFGEAARVAEASGEKDPVLTMIPPSWAPTLL